MFVYRKIILHGPTLLFMLALINVSLCDPPNCSDRSREVEFLSTATGHRKYPTIH